LDLRYSESDERFRAELRAWPANAVPEHGARRGVERGRDDRSSSTRSAWLRIIRPAWEMAPHDYLKRAWAFSTCVGTSEEHEDALATMIAH